MTVFPLSYGSWSDYANQLKVSPPVTIFKTGILAPEGIAFDMYKKFWLLSPFPVQVWMLFVATFFVCFGILAATKPLEWKHSFWLLLRVLMNQHLPATIWKTIGERCAVFTLEIMKTFLVACYGAMLIKNLVLMEKQSPASNLEQVLNRVKDGSLKLIMQTDFRVDDFEKSLTLSQFETLSAAPPSSFVYVASNTTYSDIVLKIRNEENYIYIGSYDSLRAHGNDYPNVRVVRGQSASHLQFYLLYNTNFSCSEVINFVIMKTYTHDTFQNLVDEFGTWLKHKDYVNNLKSVSQLTSPKALNITLAPSEFLVKLNVGQLLCVFYVLFVGYTVAVAGLLVEVVHTLWQYFNRYDAIDDVIMKKLISFADNHFQDKCGLTMAQMLTVANFNESGVDLPERYYAEVIPCSDVEVKSFLVDSGIYKDFELRWRSHVEKP